MHDGVFLGFDFGYRRIGVAVGQLLTGSASPLATVDANQGAPNWNTIQALLDQWQPKALIVGLPSKTDDSELYTTKASRKFANTLRQRFSLPVHLVDERFSTVEARAHLFEKGGYRKVKQTEIDSIAACIILEQWLRNPSHGDNH